MNLLPHPRSLKLFRGTFTLPEHATLQFDGSLSPDVAVVVAKRLQSVTKEIGVELTLGSARALRAMSSALAGHIIVRRTKSLPTDEASVGTREGACAPQSEGYMLTISEDGIEILFRETGGLRAATATLRQIIRECARRTDLRSVNSQARTPVPLRLPCLKIRDWPDFARRGVMLDISRGRVPKLETLLELAEHLADFKINELQLYTEHTFAYRKYKSVWRSWGALTGSEIRKLDARCRELGIDLVPNQNSFGHLRYFLEQPQLKKLAEVSQPYEDESGEFARHPTTLAPNNPGALPFLRGLYDELLPNFSSQFFNVGCDETFDLGLGRSKKLCERIGKGRVYLDFLKKIYHEVSARGKRMMFWGDIILKYPKLIKQLAKIGRADPALRDQDARQRVPAKSDCNLIALNWGYEANHPFEKEAVQFAKAKILFYVCPGTSTWQTLIGRHDNALANLRAATKAGKKFGAIGYLITDWGDGGHPQPLAVSYLPYLAGAALSWCAKTFDEAKLIPVLSRDVFADSTGKVAEAAFKLGFAHRKLKAKAPNETPLGTVITAPPPQECELFCRNGLKWFARIPAKNVCAALMEIEKQCAVLSQAKPKSASGKMFLRELDLAARLAAQSCQFMLWQQAVAKQGRVGAPRRPDAAARRPYLQMAQVGIRELRKLDKEFNAYWPSRNKATPQHCSAFLKWRIRDLLE
ncbi:MAG: family 20 glycosylhydrolase [Verrucomicrobiota bacterium]